MARSYEDIMEGARAEAAKPRIVPKPPAPAMPKPAAPVKPVTVAAHGRNLPAKKLGPIADRIQQEQALGLFRRRQGYVGD